MDFLFTIALMFEIIVQIALLIKFKRTSRRTSWYAFIGLTLASLTTALIMQHIGLATARGLNDTAPVIVICGPIILIDLILVIIGDLIYRSINKKANSKPLKPTQPLNSAKPLKTALTILTSFLIAFGINMLLALVVPAVRGEFHQRFIEEQVYSYLNQRYGDAGWNIQGYTEEYTDNGLVSSYLTGYRYEITSNLIDGPFWIQTDPKTGSIETDTFLPIYYSQQLNLEYNKDAEDWTSLSPEGFDDLIETAVIEKTGLAKNRIDAHVIYSNYSPIIGKPEKDGYSLNFYIFPLDAQQIPSLDQLIEGTSDYYLEYYNNKN